MIHCNMMDNVAHILKVFATMMTVGHQPLALNINLSSLLAMYRNHFESYLLRRATWVWWEQGAHCCVDWCNLRWIGRWPAHLTHCTSRHCSCSCWSCRAGWFTCHWEWCVVGCILRLEGWVSVWNSSHFIFISLKIMSECQNSSICHISIVYIPCWAVRCL